MTTTTELKQKTVKELTSIARKFGVVGWHELRKDELIKAIVVKARSAAAKKAREAQKNSQAKTAEPKATNKAPVKSDSAKDAFKIRPSKDTKASSKPSKSTELLKKTTEKLKKQDGQSPETGAKDISRLKTKPVSRLSDPSEAPKPQEDQLILMVRDPFWLHLYWRLSKRGVERAKAAMGHFWHTAVPVIRLYKLVADGVSSPRREFVRDIRVHSGVSHWYIDVYDPPASFLVEVGFISREGNFFPVASSNIVETPQNQVSDNADKLDGNWLEVARDFDRVYKLSGGLDGHNRDMKNVFEEQLRRPMSIPLLSRFGPRTSSEKTRRNFSFQMDADLVIHGKTDPSVQISIKGEPIRLAADGSFSVRFALSEKRQIFPIDAASSDGVETQTVILSIDRNTKILETVFRENDEE